MITRIVKLTFQEEHVAAFKDFFPQHAKALKKFPGCQGVEAFQEDERGQIFFTISRWESQEALAIYRESDLFRGIWPKVKEWMGQAPEAWTVNGVV